MNLMLGLGLAAFGIMLFIGFGGVTGSEFFLTSMKAPFGCAALAPVLVPQPESISRTELAACSRALPKPSRS